MFGKGSGDLWDMEFVKNRIEAAHMLKKVFITQLTQHKPEFFVVFQPIPVIVDNCKHVVWKNHLMNTPTEPNLTPSEKLRLNILKKIRGRHKNE